MRNLAVSPKDRNRPTASSAAAVQSRSRSNRPSAQTLSSIAHQHRHYRDSNHQGVYPHLGRQIVAVSMIVTLSACATTALQIDCTAACMATRCVRTSVTLASFKTVKPRRKVRILLRISHHKPCHRPSTSQTINYLLWTLISTTCAWQVPRVHGKCHKC